MGRGVAEAPRARPITVALQRFLARRAAARNSVRVAATRAGPRRGATMAPAPHSAAIRSGAG
jgi:hypothetical protein